jgi:hypothetical protein
MKLRGYHILLYFSHDASKLILELCATTVVNDVFYILYHSFNTL